MEKAIQALQLVLTMRLMNKLFCDLRALAKAVSAVQVSMDSFLH